MKKKTSLAAKTTVGIAAAGILMLAAGTSRKNTALTIFGIMTAFGGFAASFTVSAILNVKTLYPSRDDPFQRKMRILRYIGIAAGCIPVLGAVIMLFALYRSDGGTHMYFNLSLATIGFGCVARAVIYVITKAVSKAADRRIGSNAVPPSVTAAVPYSTDPVISRILADPYVLLDERIRQIPEVQNLLQYSEIQQVFFDPAKLCELFTRERVGELLNVIRDWIIRNNAEEIFAAAGQRRPASPTAAAVQNDKPARGDAVKNIAAVFIVLFASVFIFFIAVVLLGAIFGSHGS